MLSLSLSLLSSLLLEKTIIFQKHFNILNIIWQIDVSILISIYLIN